MRCLAANKFLIIMATASLNLEKILPIALIDVATNVTMTEITSTATVDDPSVIRVDEVTQFTFNWAATGSLLPWFNSSQMKFDVFFEQMGPGEAVIGGSTSATVLLSAGTGIISLGAGSVPSGLYRIVVRMMLLPPAPFTTPTQICGFVDLGLVEYYDV
jgi:hypothetical protein